jgi:hypothetical protein
MKKNVDTVLKTGENLVLDEVNIIQGDSVYNSTSLSPVKNVDGKVIAVAGIVRDITEIKRNQEMMEKFNRLMVGRELEMIKLKKEIADLKKDK